jgi:hypothetical protein
LRNEVIQIVDRALEEGRRSIGKKLELNDDAKLNLDEDCEAG